MAIIINSRSIWNLCHRCFNAHCNAYMNDFLVSASCLNNSLAVSETRMVVLYTYIMCTAEWWTESNNFTHINVNIFYWRVYTVHKIHYKCVKLTIFAVLRQLNNGENRRASSASWLFTSILFKSLRITCILNKLQSLVTNQQIIANFVQI